MSLQNRGFSIFSGSVFVLGRQEASESPLVFPVQAELLRVRWDTPQGRDKYEPVAANDRLLIFFSKAKVATKSQIFFSALTKIFEKLKKIRFPRLF